MYTTGIDIGSVTTKAALLNDDRVIDTLVISTGYNTELAGKKVFNEIIKNNSLRPDRVDKIVSTGYGRNSIDFSDKSITEISCHAAGAHFTNPEIKTVIDIGGQDSKVLNIDKDGKVKDFIMNDKCSAGTGRFLEVMARALECSLENFGELSQNSKSPANISSTCTVFAESEVISLISKGESRENIIAGIHQSISSRIFALVKQLGLNEPVMMTGGVAKNRGIVTSLEEKLNVPIEVNKYTQVNGAIGAAILGRSI